MHSNVHGQRKITRSSLRGGFSKFLWGTSLFDFRGPITSQNVQQFYSEPNVINEAIQRLQTIGFEVLQTNNITINIAGPPKLYEKVFKTRLITKEKPVIKPGAKEDTATFNRCTDNTPIEELIDVSKRSSFRFFGRGLLK